MTAKNLTGVRASDLVTCLRRAWYSAVVPEEADSFTQDVLDFFELRSLVNDAIVGSQAQKAREDGEQVELEAEIPWGDGWIGHADMINHSRRQVIEATTSADMSPEDRKIVQVSFYAKRVSEQVGERYEAWVFIVNPSTGERRWMPIHWENRAWELENLIADLRMHIAARREPERVNGKGETVCETPWDGPARYCPFARHCFRDWTRPPMGKLEGALALEAIRVHELRGAPRSEITDEQLRERRKAFALRLQPGAKYRVPLDDGRELQVSYSEVGESETFSLGDATKAGFELPADLKPFVRPRAGSVRLTTKIVESPQTP